VAFYFTQYRSRIAFKMMASDRNKELQRWFAFCQFAKTSNGYWLAWNKASLAEIAVLPPDHPVDESCQWLHDSLSVESAVELLESGQYAELPAWQRSKLRIKPLRPEIEARIRACYPHGQLELVDKEQCNFEYVGKIQRDLIAELPKLGAGLGVHKFETWSQLERIADAEIVFDGQANVEYIKRAQWAKQMGVPYVWCQLTLSTVFPAFRLQFRVWWPNEDDSTLLDRYLDAPWGEIGALITDCCTRHGLEQLSEEELRQPIPFVTEHYYPDDVDDEADDALSDALRDGTVEGDAAYLRTLGQIKCMVYCCLFQSH
jgi:hypothetical protein